MPRVLIVNILLTLEMRFMGRQSRQVVCGERNGRTLFAPTHICTNYKKIRTKSKTLKCKKAGCQISAKQKNSMSGTSISVSFRAEISPLPYKKRPHSGDVLVLFFCSEWCEWYACFVEDSYLAIVEPVISCIQRFFNGV